MSEVKRYRFKGAVGEYVYANDHDAAQSELSALREELALWKVASQTNKATADEYEQRLAAAEQRNVTLAALLREGLEEHKDGDDWIDRVIAALKQIKGGGDDAAHDRAYRNGLMQGYNLALNGSEKEYQDAVARYTKPTESGASE